MGWDSIRSAERAQASWDATEGLVVTDLVRETDFEGTALKNPRNVRGAHVYADVPGFRLLLGTGEPDPEVARLLHLWACEVTRIVEKDFDAVRIHFQGPRLHAVVYRPMNDDEALAVKAVLLAAAVRETASLFNTALGLTGSDRWTVAAGVDLGTALLTKDGVRGDRELLFLGNPANNAAKISRDEGVRLGDDVVDALPDDFDGHAVAHDGTHALSMTAEELEALCADHGHGWTRDRTSKRIADDDETVGDTVVVQSQGSIDKARLGLANTKETFAVSLFADVDGFTAYVEGADAGDDLDTAVRVFHTIRQETRDTAVTDYDSLRVQYQGDRMQALVHLPSGEQAKVALKAVRVAAALNSVFAHTLPAVIGSTDLGLATGLAAGTVLVTKIGARGVRDVVSLGASTAEAARIQEAIDGGDIGIDPAGYALLPDWLKPAFAWRPQVRAWVTAEPLTLDGVDLLEAAEDAERANKILGPPAYVTARPSRPEPPLRPYLG